MPDTLDQDLESQLEELLGLGGLAEFIFKPGEIHVLSPADGKVFESPLDACAAFTQGTKFIHRHTITGLAYTMDFKSPLGLGLTYCTVREFAVGAIACIEWRSPKYKDQPHSWEVYFVIQGSDTELIEKGLDSLLENL